MQVQENRVTQAREATPNSDEHSWLLAEVDFKWPMAGQGWWIDTTRSQQLFKRPSTKNICEGGASIFRTGPAGTPVSSRKPLGVSPRMLPSLGVYAGGRFLERHLRRTSQWV
jgi:hypothetical protein